MRLPAFSRKHETSTIIPVRTEETHLKVRDPQPFGSSVKPLNWTVQNSGAPAGVNCDARPASAAEDLSSRRRDELAAEVRRLRAELSGAWRVVDDLLDRESMFAGAACMERLTTAASIDRLGTPRACHLVTSTEEITAAAGFDARGIRA